MSSIQYKSTLSLVAVSTFLLGTLVVLAVFGSSPGQIGPVGVTLWFLALMMALAGGLAMVLFVVKGRLRPEDSDIVRLRSSWRQGLLMGVGVTICLALQSLRQFSLRDGILVLVLLALVEFYFRTRR